MTKEEFNDHMNMYGGDLSKWPSELQKQAYSYLQDNPQDFEELEFFKDIERELSMREKTQTSRSLVDEIMADLPDDEGNLDEQPSGLMKKAVELLSELSMGKIPAFALAGSLACGILIGVLSGVSKGDMVEDVALAEDPAYNVFYLY
ncbi:hypothetical protein [Curvivirga sp.]|uniref:hypothetical protein n=1 Tax=Curvivirga sp. TaxID=2856848 RepID=UPI003B5A56BB